MASISLIFFFKFFLYFFGKFFSMLPIILSQSLRVYQVIIGVIKTIPKRLITAKDAAINILIHRMLLLKY